MNKIRNQGKTNKTKGTVKKYELLDSQKMQAKQWPSLDQRYYLVDATKDYFVRGKIRSVLFVGKQKAAKLSKTRGQTLILQ